MFPTLLTFALLAIPAVLAGPPSINTPALTQCGHVDITWQGGRGPYNLIVVDAAQPCGDALVNLGDHDGTKLNWQVTLAAGKRVELSLEDADGSETWSGAITVGKSNDSSCFQAKGEPKPNPQTSASSHSTLTVTPTETKVIPASTPSVSSGSPGTSGNPPTTGQDLGNVVGGVSNAGNNPLGTNGALSARQAGIPVMLLGAFAAVVVASL